MDQHHPDGFRDRVGQKTDWDEQVDKPGWVQEMPFFAGVWQAVVAFKQIQRALVSFLAVRRPTFHHPRTGGVPANGELVFKFRLLVQVKVKHGESNHRYDDQNRNPDVSSLLEEQYLSSSRRNG